MSSYAKRLRYEPLEPRLALAAEDLIDFVAQPSGSLEGKIVYTSGGHGWQWSDTLNRWATDRGDNFEIVEDFGNQDQMTYFADYLLRAGATVVPMRPVGHQLNEVVLDNDSPGVTFAGAWSNSSSTIFYDEDYGAVADAVPYLFASISANETATATYRPNIPEAGYYPVYTWVRDGTDRTDQLYRIHDSAGGVTEIRVDHRMVGKGWIYLGTYHFDAGTEGSVVISNQSTAGGSVVIADAIRFGNGMGDMKDGPSGVGHSSGTISGHPREDENSLMWLWRGIGQGTSPTSLFGSPTLNLNVSAPHIMAEHMNANTNPFGSSVYIGFHSNAGGGRGAVGLINSSASNRTPNQAALALYTGRQINQDMQALNGLFEHNWSNRTTHTFTSTFGEIDGGPLAEMDMTIIETAFHDDIQDAQLMRDPKVRDQLARSTYEAVIEYFQNFGGLVDLTSQPSVPTTVTATTDASGDITVSWAPGVIGVQGGIPTAYRVYVSNNGHGYAGYVEVAGAGAGSYTFDAAALGDETLYFKVVAVNSGGESPRSAVVAARPQTLGEQKILIVDGFDRNDRAQNERYPYAFTSDGLTDRVRMRYNNSFDYVIQYGEALAAANASIDTAQNEAVISGAVTLSNYDVVIWFSGEESTADETFSVAEQALVTNYLNQGGRFLASGSEIAWDLRNEAAFLNGTFRTQYSADDAGSYNVNGVTGSILEGLSFSFDNGSQFYDVDSPDVIAPTGGATTALTYSTGSTAGIQYDGGEDGPRLVLLAFPYETITSEALRSQVMTRILNFFAVGTDLSDVDIVLDNDNGPAVYTETGSWTTSGIAGYNGLTYRFGVVGTTATATWQFYAPFAGEGEVFVQYLAGANRATETFYQIDTGNGVENVTIDQRQNSFTWVSLGTFDFTAGSHQITLDAGASTNGSVVIADVARVFIAAPSVNTGDFNGDGRVDGRDFLAWQRGYGTTGGATPEQGDGNSDGNVDADDLAIWQQQYGTVSEVQAVSSIVAVDTVLTPVLQQENSASSLPDISDISDLALLFNQPFAALTNKTLISDELLIEATYPVYRHVDLEATFFNSGSAIVQSPRSASSDDRLNDESTWDEAFESLGLRGQFKSF